MRLALIVVGMLVGLPVVAAVLFVSTVFWVTAFARVLKALGTWMERKGEELRRG